MTVKIPTTPPPQAPPSEPGYGGGRPGWALLCTAGDLYEAQLIRGVLEGDGLGPVVVEPIQTVGSWMLPSGHERTPQRIIVLAAVLDQAKLALLESGFDESEGGPAGPDAIDPGEPARPRRRSRLVSWAVAVGFIAVVVSYLVRLLDRSVGFP